MKVFRKFTALAVIVVMFVMNVINVAAESIPREAVYDMEKGGVQTFVIQDENGELAKVVVEELEGNAKISNGNYKVTFDHTLMWKAGFYVEISNNKIIRAYSPFHQIAIGTITNAKLIHDSTIQATYSFVYKQGVVLYNTGVVAKMSGTELVVSKK